jgi:hypothetical protein
MQPITFPEATNTLAKAQPQYRVLPVCIMREYPEDANSVLRYTCRYELSDLELQQIIRTKSLFISQFGFGFHPIYPQVDSPFLVLPIEYKKVKDHCFNFYVPMGEDGKEIKTFENIPLDKAIEVLTSFTDLPVEQLHFKERPSLQVDDHGNLKLM